MQSSRHHKTGFSPRPAILTAGLICCFLGAGHESAEASDAIFVAYDADGTPRFSTQPYDNNYRIYLQNPPQTAKLQPKSRIDPNHVSLGTAIQENAQKHGVDPALVRAIVAIESGFNPKAVSAKGAAGAMQLIPSTARQYGVSNPYDVQQNLDGGTRYLKDLLVTYNGNLPLALAAYNAGQGNVSKHRQRIPPFSETMLYVPKVLAKMEEYQRMDAAQP